MSSARVQEGRRCMFALRAVMCRPTNGLAHAARHESPDKDFAVKPQRPDHRSAGPVRFGDQAVVGNIDPVILKTDSIVAVLRFPTAVVDSKAPRERSTHTPPPSYHV